MPPPLSIVQHCDLAYRTRTIQNVVAHGPAALAVDSPLAHIFDILGITAFHRHGITGNGSVVGVTDSGLYMAHEQFAQTSAVFNRFDLKARKVVHYETFADDHDQSDAADHTCGHGTHVSGILAGNAVASFPMGVAPNSQLAFLDIGADCSDAPCASPIVLKIPTSIDALFLNQTKAGAKVVSYSWGSTAASGSSLLSTGTDYDDRTRAIDGYLYKHSDILLVTAAGNAGSNGVSSILSPASSKNALAVGASFADATTLALYANDSLPANCADVVNQDAVTAYSSQGPTRDGRMKPDLVAPGSYLVSAKSMPPTNDSTAGSATATCRLEGTSQATPLVAGMATLLHAWLRDGYWFNGVANTAYAMGSIPSSLLKALLLHSTTPLTRRLSGVSAATTCDAIKRGAAYFKRTPDPRQGYGRPNLKNLWNNDTPAVYFYPNHTAPSLSQGFVNDYSVTLLPGQTLRATIVWTDPPQPAASATLLTNDLDLSILVPGSQKVVFPLATNGEARDAKNNVEMVEISYDGLAALAPRSASTTGQLSATVRVTGFALQSTQEYSIVASVALGAVAVGAAPPPPTDTGGDVGTWVIYVGVAGGIIVLLVLSFFGVVLMRRKRDENGDFEALQTTVRNMFHRHVCPYCTYNSSDAVLLLAHVESAHAPTVATGREILESQRTACPHCHFKSRDAVALVYHVQAMHSSGDDAASDLSSARHADVLAR
ncbi:serine protease family S08A [Achlya hypogyna]|uniref:subtilisin n=1 Tax=Achlya hypogyna TaxID=1202772 RepID=A0A1V9YQD4_ACHHY|nr:serine protease family S08A [Achlya hypogyna]